MPLQPLASAVIHLTSEAHGTVKSVVMARSWTQPAFYFCAILGPPRSVHHKTFAMIAHREESSRKSASRISSEARSHRPSVVKKMSPGGRSQGLGGWCLNSCALLGLSLACTPCKFRAYLLSRKGQTPIAFFSISSFFVISKMHTCTVCCPITTMCVLQNVLRANSYTLLKSTKVWVLPPWKKNIGRPLKNRRLRLNFFSPCERDYNPSLVLGITALCGPK